MLAASVHFGALVESFVVQEMRRQLGWSRTRATAWHFRTAAGRAVDLVLERSDGVIVGIEVKAGATSDCRLSVPATSGCCCRTAGHRLPDS